MSELGKKDDRKQDEAKPKTFAERVAEYEAHFNEATYFGKSISGEQKRAHDLVHSLFARVEELEQAAASKQDCKSAA